MRVPMPPPDLAQLEAAMAAGRRDDVLERLSPSIVTRDYLPWDTVRFKTPPPGLTHEEWWWLVRTARRASARQIPSLRDCAGRPLTFNLPDELLSDLDRITRDASGHISISEQVTNPATRDRYLVSSLIEESVRSSQLEGAATTRRVAAEMIRSGRAPRDRSERMIVNNYRAMAHVAQLRGERLTPDVVREVHRIVTDGTLIRPESAGRLQDSDDDRVQVWSDSGELLHRPPPVIELPDRLDRLCAFANAESDDGYVPPVLRAMAVHFMVGHDHYFEDGNGRTARALFYWAMLRQGYWLTEFLAISTVLRDAPARYGTAFLLTEQDGGDLTYFFMHQSAVVLRAIAHLHEYLARKGREAQEMRVGSSGAWPELNHRQLDLLQHAARTSLAQYTIESHRRSHGTVTETARQDLLGLETAGLLVRAKVGRRFVWSPVPDLDARLRDPDRS